MKGRLNIWLLCAALVIQVRRHSSNFPQLPPLTRGSTRGSTRPHRPAPIFRRRLYRPRNHVTRGSTRGLTRKQNEIPLKDNIVTVQLWRVVYP